MQKMWVVLALFLVLVFVGGFIFWQKVINREGGFSLKSLNSGVQVSFSQTSFLDNLAKGYRVWDSPAGIAIPNLDGSARWLKVNKIEFVYTSENQNLVDVTNGQVPILSYAFNYEPNQQLLSVKYSLLAIKQRSMSQDKINLEVSRAIVRMLYRITHYLPKAQYTESEISNLQDSCPPFIQVKYI